MGDKNTTMDNKGLAKEQCVYSEVMAIFTMVKPGQVSLTF